MGALTPSRRSLFASLLMVAALPVLSAGAPALTQSRVEAAVTAAEAVRAVKRVQHAWAHYLDEGRWSDLGDLLADDVDATFGGATMRGPAEVRRHVMAAAGRAGEGLAAGQLHTHLIMQPIITLGADGRTAKGTWHELALLGTFGKSAEWRGGIHENEYVRDGNAWKISRIRYIEQYRGAYEDQGHKAPAKWNIPYHFDSLHVGVTVPQAALVSLQREGGTSSHATLSRRVALLHDETAVQNLQHAFGYYFDRKLWDDVADLFAGNGELELAGRGAYAGRERIRRALEIFHGPTPLKRGELFDHIMLGTVVTIGADGNSAGARSVQLAQLGQTGEYARWEVGVYENTFVKEAGKWKIASVRYFPRMATDYDLGWAHDARPVPAVSTAFAPDRRPAKYASYPVLQSVAPHFAHPVTGRVARTVPGALMQTTTVKPASRSTLPGPAPTPQQLDELDRQAARAVAFDAVENLNSSYGYYIDESDWDGMANTYALNDGAKELTGAGVYIGRERIRTALKLRGPAGGRSASFFTIHQLVQPVIHVADDGRSAKARLRLFQDGGNADGSSGSWIGGIYENTAVFENGEWKFGIQDLHHILNASYRNGWARLGGATLAAATPPRAANRSAAGTGAAPAAAGAAPGAAASRETRGGGIAQGLGGAASPASWQSQYPPDRRIRARQYAFPDIDEPAFHYVNPVSGRAPRELMPDYPLKGP